MRTLSLFALLASATAFAGPVPAKDVIAETQEASPNIFEMSRPVLNRFYVSVSDSRSAKDDVKNTNAAPVKAKKAE